MAEGNQAGKQNVREVRGPGMRGRRGAPLPKLEHPWALFGRIMKYVTKGYLLRCILVAVLIIISVLASVQGTLFTRTLIDRHIMPMLASDNPDFSGLAAATGRVACFYGAGVADPCASK